MGDSQPAAHRDAQRVRVLHLHGEREDIGGILSVIRNLQSRGSETGSEHEVLQNSVYRETRTPNLKYRYSSHLVAESTSHLELFVGAICGVRGIVRAFRQGSFDVIHGHSRGALLVCGWLAATSRIPVVFTNHAFANRIWLYRWAAKRRGMSTCVLTPNMAKHYGFDTNDERIHVVSECCHDRFFELPLVKRRYPGRDKIKLLGLGSITHGKKWHLGLQAISKLSKEERQRIQLDIWGPIQKKKSSKDYYRQQTEYIREHGLDGCCKFHAPTQTVEEPLSDADFFFLPRTDEPCSVALIEALAMGLPAIVSRSGGNVDIIDHGRTGLLFQPDDPDELVKTLRSVLDGSFEPASPAVVRESVRHRSAKEVAERYMDVYRGRLGREK